MPRVQGSEDEEQKIKRQKKCYFDSVSHCKIPDA